jgi:hypothetical protein
MLHLAPDKGALGNGRLTTAGVERYGSASVYFRHCRRDFIA